MAGKSTSRAQGIIPQKQRKFSWRRMVELKAELPTRPATLIYCTAGVTALGRACSVNRNCAFGDAFFFPFVFFVLLSWDTSVPVLLRDSIQRLANIPPMSSASSRYADSSSRSNLFMKLLFNKNAQRQCWAFTFESKLSLPLAI